MHICSSNKLSHKKGQRINCSDANFTHFIAPSLEVHDVFHLQQYSKILVQIINNWFTSVKAIKLMLGGCNLMATNYADRRKK